MDQLYKEIILENWQNPQNYGLLKNADIDVTGNNPFCGDEIHLTMKLKDGKVYAVGFEGEGCAISKASASLFSEEIKDKKIEDLRKVKPEEVLTLLNITLTPTRTKCALLIYKTLQKGLNNL